MKTSLRSIVLIAVALLLCLPGAQFAMSAEAKYSGATDVVSPGSDLTYFDLALQFAPGLAKAPSDGDEISKLPHLGGDDDVTTIASPALGGVERIDIEFDGKPAVLLMFDFGQSDDSAASVNVLALYDMSSKPRLLDALDVGLDRETSFMEPGHISLSPRFGMAFVRNSHHNAGEEYLQTSLIGIWGGKLREVDTIFTMSWFANGEDLRVLPSFASVKGAIGLHFSYDVRRTQCDGGCVPYEQDYPSTTERITARYSWDPGAGKFVRPAKAFDKIPLPDMEE